MKDTALLRRRILSRRARVAVVGQGYVGLSLACAAADSDFHVTGIDVNERRVGDLVEGVLSVPGVPEAEFGAALATGKLTFTTDTSAAGNADVVCICVPTPARDHVPDLSFVEAAARDLGDHLRPGRLVVLESTTFPGTTEGPVREILEGSNLAAGRDFLLAYSPERINPGNGEYGFGTIPRIVGGFTPEATGMASLFYGQLVDKVVTVSSCRAAELAKLLENTYRHVNIALVNELAMLCHDMDIDVWEIIDAAATKPFGFTPFYPGPGVGGNCIPVDPMYLAWHVRRNAGHRFRTLEQAEEINQAMPAYVATRIGDALNEAGKPVKGAHVLVLGVSYKQDVGEIAESPSVKVAEVLERRGARVAFHDPYVEEVTVAGRVQERVDLTHRSVSGADLVAVLTPHSGYDLEWIAERAALLFDARNAFGQQQRKNVVRL
ncbi:MAG: nucleotide sugar dehydrogenase [Actinomycetota bacterium]